MPKFKTKNFSTTYRLVTLVRYGRQTTNGQTTHRAIDVLQHSCRRQKLNSSC